MSLVRLLDLGRTTALRSQAIYHAVAECAAPDDAPTLCLLHPDRPYVSIGYHQQADREIDLAYCRARDIPVIRRRVGGGAVLLDEHQLFFHLVVPRQSLVARELPARIDARYRRLVSPAIAAYGALGIATELRPPNDIQVAGPPARKIGGTGMADIGEALVFVGSMMLAFDHGLMARVLAFADETLREPVRESITENVTSLERELGRRPGLASVQSALVRGFRDALGVELVRGDLSAEEDAAAARLCTEFASDEWLHHIAWSRDRPRKLVINGAVRYAEGETSNGSRVAVRVTDGSLNHVYRSAGSSDDAEIAALTEKLVEYAAA